MAITVKFDLEMIQIDTVNAFVYCNFNKVVYMKLLLRFNNRKKDKVRYLRKALIDYNNYYYYGRRILQAY